jgi:hypothetical protein
VQLKSSSAFEKWNVSIYTKKKKITSVTIKVLRNIPKDPEGVGV